MTRRTSLLRSSLLPALMLALLVGGCASDETAGPTVEQIVDNPAEYVGEAVTVSGEVDAVYGPNAFTIGGELVVIVPPDADVVGRTAGALPFAAPDLVEITGIVRESTLADLEAEYEIDLDPALASRITDERPALVALAVGTL